jgi:hypothetical protein
VANEVTIIVRGKDAASSILSGVQTQAKNLGGQLGSLGSAVGSIGSAMQQAVIPAAAVGVAVNKVTEAALEDEASQTRMKQAVIAAGQNWDEYGKQLEGVAKKGIDMGFADEETRESLALLVAQTGDADEAMRRLAVAQDVARGTGMDLHTAAKLVGKVTDESVNVFGRYGIKLDATMNAQEALAAVQGKFAGQAKAYAESNAGAIESMRLKYGELQEQIGGALTPTLVKLTDVFTALPAPVQTGIATAMAFGGAIGPLIPALGTLGPALMSLGTILLTPPLGFVVALAAAGVAIYIFRDDIAKGLGWAVDKAKELLGALGNLVKGIPDFLQEHWQAIVQGALLILFPPGAGLFYIVTHFSEVKEQVGKIVGGIVSGIEALPGRVLAFMSSWGSAGASLAGSLVNGIKGGITDLIGAIPGMAGELATAFLKLIKDGWNAMIDWADRNLRISIGTTIFGRHVSIEWDPDLSIFRLAGGIRGFPGGLAIVGERGPELVALPAGADVYSNRESREMFGGTTIYNYGRVTNVFPNTDPRAALRETDKLFRGV